MVALAALLDGQEDRDEAERLYARAIAVFEREADAARPELAVAVNNLAAIRQAQKRRAEAESLYRRALALNAARLGEQHPQVAFCANNLGVLLTERGRAPEAARLLRTAVGIFRRAFGPRSPNVGRCLENYAAALRALGRRREASAIDRRAERILSRVETVNDAGAAATATINPDRARFQLIVGPSAISRLGVFAEEPIPARRRVIEYTGERIDRREARRRSNPTRSYLFAADEHCLDGAIGGSGAEYVNHSCAPNLEARAVDGRILYFSLSEIGAGEELTIDYRYPPTIEPVPCHCGAASCRGTINVTRADDGTSGLRRRRASRSQL
jgi:tetratricopeptide (TPR) repeat protein